MSKPSPAHRGDAELGAESSPEDETLEREAAQRQFEVSKLFAPHAGGRPAKPCAVCGGPREGGQRVSVGGKRIPVCRRCAGKTRTWQGPDLRPDARRGRAKSTPASFGHKSDAGDVPETSREFRA